jgi:tripartite-type tricarboxylate transporter receptor subunit TctC
VPLPRQRYIVVVLSERCQATVLSVAEPHCLEYVMSFGRRRFLRLATAIVTLPAASRMVGAQTYPNRPVRIVVGYPPGGVNDIYARLISRWLSERLGQSFIVENRPGAAGTIGVDAVVRAPADGYTLLLSSGNDAYNELIYPDIKFSFIRDIAPVAGIAITGNIMIVNPAFPAASIPEFIAYAKSNPGGVNFASGGIGSGQHICGEMFKMMTGVNMIHVPYRGGAPAVSDLLAGQVQVMFEFMASALPHVRSGGLRALGVTSTGRFRELPDVPAVGEYVPGFEYSGWFGLVAPRQTPPAIVNRLNFEINATLDDPEVRARIAELGSEPLSGSPADFVNVIAVATAKSSKVIRTAGIKAG